MYVTFLCHQTIFYIFSAIALSKKGQTIKSAGFYITRISATKCSQFFIISPTTATPFGIIVNCSASPKLHCLV